MENFQQWGTGWGSNARPHIPWRPAFSSHSKKLPKSPKWWVPSLWTRMEQTAWVVVMGSGVPWGTDNQPPTHRESCCQGGSTHTHTGSPPVGEGIHTEPRIPGTGSGGQGGTGYRLQESSMGKALPPQHLAGPSEAGGDAGSTGHHPELQPAASYRFALTHQGCHWQNRARLPVPSTGQFR